MKTDLDALLTALYVHLDDVVLPSANQPRRPGRPCLLTNAELICVAVAQALLRHDSERHWMRAAPARIGHLFPRLPGQSEYNRHLRRAAPDLLRAIVWLARAVPTWWEQLRLMDGTPLRCGASRVTAHRSALGGMAGYGVDKSHHASSGALQEGPRPRGSRETRAHRPREPQCPCRHRAVRSSARGSGRLEPRLRRFAPPGRLRRDRRERHPGSAHRAAVAAQAPGMPAAATAAPAPARSGVVPIGCGALPAPDRGSGDGPADDRGSLAAAAAARLRLSRRAERCAGAALANPRVDRRSAGIRAGRRPLRPRGAGGDDPRPVGIAQRERCAGRAAPWWSRYGGPLLRRRRCGCAANKPAACGRRPRPAGGGDASGPGPARLARPVAAHGRPPCAAALPK